MGTLGTNCSSAAMDSPEPEATLFSILGRSGWRSRLVLVDRQIHDGKNVIVGDRGLALRLGGACGHRPVGKRRLAHTSAL